MSAEQISNGKDGDTRARWMGLLARANADFLKQLSDRFGLPQACEIIRGPEEGLVMVRGRAGGVGRPFNIGEITVTRCSVRLTGGAIGHAYVAGRRPDHAERAAVIDAVMQIVDQAEAIERAIMTPLFDREQEDRHKQAQRVAKTRVDFFTVVRGED